MHLLRFFLLLAALLGYGPVLMAQTESEHPLADTLPAPTFVHLFKDSRLDILEKRAYRLDYDEKLNGGEKETVVGKPLVSANGKKKVTGSIYTTKGFRIVVYNGPDRRQAMDAKNKFSNAFSSERSYMSYNVPSYKIKVGDFENKKDATDFLRRVSVLFPASFIVPDIVTIKNINVSE